MVALAFQAHGQRWGEGVLGTKAVLVMRVAFARRQGTDTALTCAAETAFGFGVSSAHTAEQGPPLGDGQGAHQIKVQTLDARGARDGACRRCGGIKTETAQIEVTRLHGPVGGQRHTDESFVGVAPLVFVHGARCDTGTHQALRSGAAVKFGFGFARTDAAIHAGVDEGRLREGAGVGKNGQKRQGQQGSVVMRWVGFHGGCPVEKGAKCPSQKNTSVHRCAVPSWPLNAAFCLAANAAAAASKRGRARPGPAGPSTGPNAVWASARNSCGVHLSNGLQVERDLRLNVLQQGLQTQGPRPPPTQATQ